MSKNEQKCIQKTKILLDKTNAQGKICISINLK